MITDGWRESDREGLADPQSNDLALICMPLFLSPRLRSIGDVWHIWQSINVNWLPDLAAQRNTDLTWSRCLVLP